MDVGVGITLLKFYNKVFLYVMSKVLSGKLSSMPTCLVNERGIDKFMWKILTPDWDCLVKAFLMGGHIVSCFH